MNTTILKKICSRFIALLTLTAIFNIVGVGSTLWAFWRVDTMSWDEDQFKFGTGVWTYGTWTWYWFWSWYGSQDQWYYFDSWLNINTPVTYSWVTSWWIYSWTVIVNFNKDNLKRVLLDNSLVYSAGNMTGSVSVSWDWSHSLQFVTITDYMQTLNFTINSNSWTNNTWGNNTWNNNTWNNNTGSNAPVINSVISKNLMSTSNTIEFGFTDDSEDWNAYVTLWTWSSYNNVGSGVVSVVTGSMSWSYTGYADFTGLKESTLYNFRILLVDSDSNSAQYTGTFTTLSGGNQTWTNNTWTNNTWTNQTGTNQTWNNTWLDTMPDSFSFNMVNNAKLNTYYTSNSITVTWINSWARITVTWWMYSINSWSWYSSFTSAEWIVNSGDKVKVKVKSSNSYSTSVTWVLSIWWLTWNFVVTTMVIPATWDDDSDNVVDNLSGMMWWHIGVDWNNLYSPFVIWTDNLINNIVNNLFQSISWNNNNFLQTLSWNVMYYNTINNNTIIRNNIPYYTSIFNINSNNMALSLPMFDSTDIQDSVNSLTKRILNEVWKRKIYGSDLDNVFSYYKDMMSAMKVYEDEQNPDMLWAAQINRDKLSDIIDDYPVIKPSKKLKDDEFEYALSFMNKNKLTKYDSVDEYRPTSNLTRQEAAKFYVEFVENVLWEDMNQTNNDNCNFEDIDDADPSLKDYIIKACNYGIMKWSNWKFKPNQQMSKAEALAVLVRAMQDNKNMSTMEDEDSETPWYKDYYEKAYDNWRTKEDDYTQLDRPLSRYEAWLLMHRSAHK